MVEACENRMNSIVCYFVELNSQGCDCTCYFVMLVYFSGMIAYLSCIGFLWVFSLPNDVISGCLPIDLQKFKMRMWFITCWVGVGGDTDCDKYDKFQHVCKSGFHPSRRLDGICRHSHTQKCCHCELRCRV